MKSSIEYIRTPWYTNLKLKLPTILNIYGIIVLVVGMPQFRACTQSLLCSSSCRGMLLLGGCWGVTAFRCFLCCERPNFNLFQSTDCTSICSGQLIVWKAFGAHASAAGYSVFLVAFSGTIRNFAPQSACGGVPSRVYWLVYVSVCVCATVRVYDSVCVWLEGLCDLMAHKVVGKPILCVRQAFFQLKQIFSHNYILKNSLTFCEISVNSCV